MAPAPPATQDKQTSGAGPSGGAGRIDAPHSAGRRVGVIDTVRGFALLGILVPNMWIFAWPSGVAMDPGRMGEAVELVNERTGAGLTANETANAWAGHLTSTLFVGKFMFLFATLFGAGVVLFSRRYDEPEDGAASPAAVKASRRLGATRWHMRCGWLLLFGLIHGFLLWFGDILTFYAAAGLVAAWWLRRLRPRTQLVLAGALHAVGTLGWLGVTGLAAIGIERGSVTPEEVLGVLGPELDAYGGGSIGAMLLHRLMGFGFYLLVMPFTFFWQVLGLMLLGMGLTRSGVLTGERSPRYYAVMAGVGLPVGLAITAGLYAAVGVPGFELAPLLWLSIAQFVGAPLALGYLGAVILVVKLGLATPATDALASVGRMALSNYLLQTLLCTTLFYGHAGGLYARVQFPALAGVIAAVWAINIGFTVLWMRWFRFGPAEWLWRSLTYLRPQPIRRTGPIPAAASRPASGPPAAGGHRSL